MCLLHDTVFFTYQQKYIHIRVLSNIYKNRLLHKRRKHLSYASWFSGKKRTKMKKTIFLRVKILEMP